MKNKSNSISVRGWCGGITGLLWFNAMFFFLSALIYGLWYDNAESFVSRVTVAIISLGFGGVLFALINLLPKTEEEILVEVEHWMVEPANTSQAQTGNSETGNVVDKEPTDTI